MVGIARSKGFFTTYFCQCLQHDIYQLLLYYILALEILCNLNIILVFVSVVVVSIFVDETYVCTYQDLLYQLFGRIINYRWDFHTFLNMIIFIFILLSINYHISYVNQLFHTIPKDDQLYRSL